MAPRNVRSLPKSASVSSIAQALWAAQRQKVPASKTRRAAFTRPALIIKSDYPISRSNPNGGAEATAANKWSNKTGCMKRRLNPALLGEVKQLQAVGFEVPGYEENTAEEE